MVIRFLKSTHIYMISNSDTHLRSYTNSAITGNSSPISLETLHECRYCRAMRRCHWAERQCLRIERRYRHIKWWVFRDVSQCFKRVSWCFTMFWECFMIFYKWFTMFYDVSQLFLLLCFTMFSESRIDRHRWPHAPPANHLRSRDNATEIGNNSAEIGDDAIGIVDITAKVIQC